MLIVIVAALLGIWRYRSTEYFKWVAIAAVWMFAAGILFQAGGTLSDPSGDGIITHQVRIATEDGPMMGIFAIGFLVAYYGGLIFFITRMVKAARTVRDAPSLSEWDESIEPDPQTTRKVLETAGLLALSAAWVWFAFIQPMQRHDQAMDAAIASQTRPLPSPTGLTIEQELLGAAAEINANAPQRLDEVTTLERATVKGREFTYHYTIEASAAERDNLLSFIRTNVVPQACTGSMRDDMRTHGVSYTYSYVGTDFETPIELTVDDAMCLSLER